VSKKDGSFRPVVNLRPLNQFMERVHFKMENLRELLKHCNLMPSIDLKDAYLSVEPSKIPLLSIAGQSVRISVPPIWPIQCTWCFHQAVKPVLAHLHHQGICLIMFGQYSSDVTVQGGAGESFGPDHLLEMLGFVIK